MKTSLSGTLVFLLGVLATVPAFAAPVPFSGKLAINGLNFSGAAAFTFALRDQNGTVHWRNGANADDPINVPVDRGHYLVLLGGQGMNPLPANLFLNHPELYLQVHFFRPDSGQWLHLQPDQRIHSAPHALAAEVARNAIVAELAKAVEAGAVTKSMLAAEVLSDLNRTFSISPGSITANLLAPGLLDQNVTLAPGSVTKSMLAEEVLADLNATSGSDGNGSTTTTIPAGSLIAVQAGQSAPTGYSLYQQGEHKQLIWEEKAPVSLARNAYDGVEVLDGKLYLIGGWKDSTSYNLAERYDPASNQWETLAVMSVARAAVATAVLNGKLYAIGGAGHSSVEIFDLTTGQWSTGPALPAAVSHGTAITVNGKILLAGGRNAADQKVNQLLELDPGTNQWSQKAAMPTARYGLKLVLFEGKVWAIGGHSTTHLNKVEIYDPVANSWSTGSSLTTVRYYPSAWTANGRIYVAGGYTGSSYLNTIEAYDPETNQWTATGVLPENKYVADAAVLGGKVYIVAGSRAGGVYSNKVYAADLNASVAGVFDLYRRDGNASSGGSGGTAAIAPNSITTNQLSETILKYLKPEITTPPQPATVYPDSNASFSVAAEGKYLTYQWRRNGADLPGETNATLTITDANATLHEGNYTVTVSNDFGNVESETASFSVVDSNAINGLVGWWKFDETNSGIAYDSSGNLRNGSLIGFDSNLTQWVQGKIGGALQLDGTNDYVNVDGYKGILGSSPRTIAAWVKTNLGNAAILAWGTMAIGKKWVFRIQNDAGLAGASRVEVHTGNIVGNVVANDNQWHHVAAVLSAGTDNVNQVVLYVDGTNAVSSSSVSRAINTVSGSDVVVGKQVLGGTPHYFNGLIDDVRIYDRGLSAAEVQALYQLGQ